MSEYGNGEENKEECRDFKRNVCTKGDACKYYHPPTDVNSIFERNSVCHDFQNPKGCLRDTCKFLHITKEQEDYIKQNGKCPPSLSQQEMDKILGLPPFCNDYMRGTCTRGNSCKFRHVGEPGTGRPMRGGRGPSAGGGNNRYEPYGRPEEDPFGRMEMKRRYREDMMEDEIMYLRAQVGRLKRQIADLAAANESMLDENARLRVGRPIAAYDTAAAAARVAAAPPPRAPEYAIPPRQSPYPYSSSATPMAANVAPLYSTGTPY